MRSFFKWATRRWWRSGAVLLAFLVFAAVVAPFVDAAPYARSIQRALEASLGRKVTFSEAHFSLLFGPGFSLSNVSIGEDPRFGVEDFAFVPTLNARLRLDQLLTGHIVFSSLRLVEPSINLVRADDGSWNMVELAGRLSDAGGASIHLFPGVQISDGRVDFKVGVRKTNIYVTDANLSLYAEDGGKLYIQFSGSPARTDRAGNGFGHLSGHVNWYPRPANPKANQIEGKLTLDRSNLSELSTLFQGEDAGVHGMVSGEARVAGPASALHLSGDLRFEDIHRWDLLPSRGEDWTVAYEGVVDLPARSIDLKTIPQSGSAPVQLAVKGTDFLSHPSWSLLANLNAAPVTGLLPLAKRMGLGLPDGLNLDGAISGGVGYSTGTGWTGGVGIANFVAALPNLPPFRSKTVQATIQPDRIHLESDRITSNGAGWLDVGGDYDLHGRALHLALTMNTFPIATLRDMFANAIKWPQALDSLQRGELTGALSYRWAPEQDPLWSGRFDLSGGTVAFQELPDPITDVKGQFAFNAGQVDIEHLVGAFAQHPLEGSFSYDADGKRPERIKVVYKGADLADLEALLIRSRRESWLARLGVTRYHAPEWMLRRDLQGDLDLPNLSLNRAPLGDLHAHLRWFGTNLQLTNLRLRMTEGDISANGTINLSGSSPRYRLTGSLSGLPWHGGFLSAKGQLQSSGSGSDVLQRLGAEGTFTVQDVALSADDEFEWLSGNFQLSFSDGWPDLRLSSVQATDGDEQWTGAATSSSDGKLILDLQHEGRQRHIVSTVTPDATAASAAIR